MRVLAYWICDGNQPCDLAVDHHEHDGRTLAAQLASPCSELIHRRFSRQDSIAADHYRVFLDGAAHAATSDGLKVVGLGQGQSLGARTGNYRVGQRMLAGTL